MEWFFEIVKSPGACGSKRPNSNLYVIESKPLALPYCARARAQYISAIISTCTNLGSKDNGVILNCSANSQMLTCRTDNTSPRPHVAAEVNSKCMLGTGGSEVTTDIYSWPTAAVAAAR